MSSPRITAAARLQRLLAMLQWAAGFPEGVPVADLCDRFRLKHADLARELDLASMIGADSPNYDEMPFEVFVEDGLVFVRLFSFRQPMRLTPAEGLALVAAADVLVDRSAGDDVAGPLERALAKLADLLGIEPGDAIDVDLDPTGGEAGTSLRHAIDADLQAAFTYWTYGRDAVERRVIDPWLVHTERGSWYVTGWAHDAGAQRTFRLDRMEEVEVLDAPRTQPPPRSIETGAFGDEAIPQAILDLAPAARWVADAHPVLHAEPAADGHLRITLAVTGPAWLERLLVRLGPDATVVAIDAALGGPDLGAQAAGRVLDRYLPADRAR